MDKSPLTSFLRCYGGDGLEREGGGEQLRLAGPSGHPTGMQITDMNQQLCTCRTLPEQSSNLGSLLTSALL